MGARNTSCDEGSSMGFNQPDYITYKGSAIRIYNPEILDSMVPSKDPGVQGNILLDMGKWRQFQLKHFCSLISQWNFGKGLWLGWNNQPQIITDIIGIRFQFMQSLSLDWNSIHSIELLCHIWMPNLIHLNIQHNNIVYMRPLRKLPQKLHKLQINNNPINDMKEQLSMLCTGQLAKIYLSGEGLFMVRMDMRAMEQIWIKRKTRKSQQQTIKKLKNKTHKQVQVIPSPQQ